MIRFTHLRLRTQLMIACAGLALLVGVAGLMGLRATQTLATNTDTLYRYGFEPLSHLLQIIESFQRTRVYAQNFIMISDSAEFVKMHKTVRAMYKKNDSLNALYRTALKDAADSLHFERYLQTEREFRTAYAELMHLGEIGEKDAAITSLRKGAGQEAGKRYHFAIDTLRQEHLKEAKIIQEQSITSANALKMQIIIFTVLALCLGLLIGYLLARSISRPIEVLNRAARQVAKGNNSVSVNIERQDEIGTLAMAFNTMVQNIQSLLQEVRQKSSEFERAAAQAEQARAAITEHDAYLVASVEEMLREMDKFAHGNLMVQLNAKRYDSIGQLFEGFNTAVGNIAQIIEKVRNAVFSSASVSSQISVSTEQMSASAKDQILQTSEIASSVQTMMQAVENNTSQTRIVVEMAQTTEEAAHTGSKSVAATKEGMQRIAMTIEESVQTIFTLQSHSERISEAANMIDDIAQQTNLLALNAAIEAARAGESGRGFAVVADEVRKLADKTTTATQEIARLINSIRQQTERAVSSVRSGMSETEHGILLVNRAEEALTMIINRHHSVVEAIERIATTSDEQFQATRAVFSYLDTINLITEQSAQGLESIAYAANDLNQMTEQLESMIQIFTLK